MKRIAIIATVLVIGSLIFTGCKKDFLDVNVDPKAANIDQVQVEYLLNNSITEAQMNPHIAERGFCALLENCLPSIPWKRLPGLG